MWRELECAGRSILKGHLDPSRFAYGKPFPGPSQGYGPGRHTRLWQELSWCLGDEHADRICKLIDLYVRVFNLRGRGWSSRG